VVRARARLIALPLLALPVAAEEPGEPPPGWAGPPDDLRAIGRLHEVDATASRAKDYETLIGLWADDIVALPPGAPITRGKDEGRRAVDEMAEQMAAVEIARTIYN
jgi:hypothetical protein